MAEASKDTIYVDVDDEITSIIDKIASSDHKIIALVLPKRAAVLQSIVNMKLLKRSGDTHKKKLVLITSESGLLPLAGAVKLHVAKTLQSKPAIPAAPDVPSDDIALGDAEAGVSEDDAADDLPDDIESDEVSDEPLDKEKTVGELATAKKVSQSVKSPIAPAEETIDLDDEAETDAEDVAEAKPAGTGKGDKKLKIPNFEKFRTKLLIGGGVFVVLLIGLYLANFVLPTAKIIIKTNDVSVNTSVNFTASTSTKTFDEKQGIIPAIEKQVQKTDAEKVTATGKKNVGEKATGTVSLKLTDCAQDEVTIPSGTGVSNGGQTFITQTDISFNSVKIGNKCQNASFPSFTTGTVKVVAQNPGDQYNISGGRTFTVSGFSNVAGTDSSAMTGGTNREVTVVSDQDIETAKQKLNDKSKDAALTDLKKQFQDADLFSIVETFGADAPTVTAAPAVGTEASDVTVTSIVIYKMLGVKRDQLKALVVNSAKSQIDSTKQSIQNDGLTKAIFRVTDKKSSGLQTLSVQSTVSTGAEVNEDALKAEVAGKKKGEVQLIVGNRPGVKEVDVDYSPFWVYKTPKNPKKITFVFEQTGNASN